MHVDIMYRSCNRKYGLEWETLIFIAVMDVITETIDRAHGQRYFVENLYL